MTDLKLPLLTYQERLKYRIVDDQKQIFCTVRRKWVQLGPEEMVRQLILQHLIQSGYSPRLIKLEQKINIPDGGSFYRADIIIYNRDLKPCILIECKAPTENINEEVYKQISRYNQLLNIQYLIISNGPHTFGCAIDFDQNNLIALKTLPIPAELN